MKIINYNIDVMEQFRRPTNGAAHSFCLFLLDLLLPANRSRWSARNERKKQTDRHVEESSLQLALLEKNPRQYLPVLQN